MAHSGSEKKETKEKESAKGKISASSSLEDLIHAYLEEGNLIAVQYIQPYLYQPRNKNDRNIRDKMIAKAESKAELWPDDVEAFKKVEPEEFKKKVREQTLLGEIFMTLRSSSIFIKASEHYEAMITMHIRRAANQREPRAMSFAADFFDRGSYGFPHNSAQAAKFRQEAATQGEANAQYALGDSYESGNNPTIPQNFETAVYWYQQSAERGNPLAQLALAGMYEMGRGLPQDIGKAASLYSGVILQGLQMYTFYQGARDQLANLLIANPNHLLVVFYAAVAQCHIDQGYVNSLLHTTKRDRIIRQLNTLLINLTQSAEEKKDPTATQQLHEFYKAAYGASHKTMLSVLTDKRNLERWEQYVLKQGLLEQRFSQIASPMPQLGAHILSFLGSMNPQQSADIKTAVAKHRSAPDARQNAVLIQAVLKGEFDADVKLYRKLQAEVGKSKLKPKSEKQEIRDYGMLEKFIKEEGKKARSPIDLDVALGVLYYAAGDYKKAADQFLKASRAEDSRGYFHLGKMYENGHLFRKSGGAAKECYAKAEKLTEEMKAKGEVKHGKSDSPKR